MRVWSRLDRAIAREIRGPLWLGLAGFTLVMILNYLFQLARLMVEKHVPTGLLLGFVLSQIPRIVMFTIPMAVLLAVLVGVGRMATQSEVIALRSAGVSLGRIFRPVLVVSTVVTLLGLLCTEYLMPLGATHERELIAQVLRSQDLNREIEPGVFYDKLPGAVLYARAAGESLQGRTFLGLLLYREALDGQSVDLLVAERGRAFFNRQTGQRGLLLDHGEWHMLRPAQPEQYNVVRFEQYTLPFPPDPSFTDLTGTARGDEPQRMDPGELHAFYDGIRQKLAKTRDAGERLVLSAQMRRAGLEWHRRIALPMSAIGFAFLAFPIAARSRRGGRFAGLSQALALILVFYLALTLGWSLSEKGTWPPWLGPWTPILVSAAWAAVSWWRLPRAERGGRTSDWGARLLGVLRRLARRRRPEERAMPAAQIETGDPSPSRVIDRFAPGHLDLFLGSAYLRMFGAVLFVLLVLVLAFGFRTALDQVDPQAKHFPWGPVLRFLALSSPSQLRFMVPIAALFGASISLSALARTGEITALKAAGIGPVRMALTLLTITAGIAAVYAVAQETVLPAAERESYRALDRVRGKVSGPELLETGRRWLVGEPGRIWNYIDWDARRQQLITPGVISVDLTNARVVERIQAGRVQKTESGWRFLNGWRRTFLPDGTSRWDGFQALDVDFRESADLFGETRSRLMLGDALADQLTFAKLWRNFQQSARTGYPAAPLLVGLNEKLVFPLLPLCLLLLGVPMAVTGWHRKGSLYGFGISILIVFGFWVTHAVLTSLGREGILNPVIATWLPTALLVVTGGMMLRRAR